MNLPRTHNLSRSSHAVPNSNVLFWCKEKWSWVHNTRRVNFWWLVCVELSSAHLKEKKLSSKYYLAISPIDDSLISISILIFCSNLSPPHPRHIEHLFQCHIFETLMWHGQVGEVPRRGKHVVCSICSFFSSFLLVQWVFFGIHLQKACSSNFFHWSFYLGRACFKAGTESYHLAIHWFWLFRRQTMVSHNFWHQKTGNGRPCCGLKSRRNTR